MAKKLPQSTGKTRLPGRHSPPHDKRLLGELPLDAAEAVPLDSRPLRGPTARQSRG